MKIIIIFISLFFIGCSSDMKHIDEIFKSTSRPLEKGSNLSMTYSDSAKTLLLLESPIFESKNIGKEKIIEYPKGIKISFLNKDNTSNSWLTADIAINKVKDKKFIFKQHVKLFNKTNDKLETSELIWDEKKEILYTEKFIKITQPDKGDTLYGYGFESNKEFTEFEIKRKLSGKMVESIFSDIK
jgi:LPS export ABC transporter protein LptC